MGMTHNQLASNALVFGDDNSMAIVSIYPSSPESGAAVIGTAGQDGTLVSLDGVRALRDFLTLCLEQAAQESPFAVVEPEKPIPYDLRLSFTPNAIREHYADDESDPTEGLSDEVLEEVGRTALLDDGLYRAFHDALDWALGEVARQRDAKLACPDCGSTNLSEPDPGDGMVDCYNCGAAWVPNA